jgi:hypothetical protein
MQVVCHSDEGCGRYYDLPTGRKRFKLCPDCRAKLRRRRRKVRQSRSAARTEAIPDPAVGVQPSLKELMDAADAAAARALARALSVAPKR